VCVSFYLFKVKNLGFETKMFRVSKEREREGESPFFIKEEESTYMRPSRVSHSASIGPGVVPRGVDPDYDAEVAKEYEARKHVAHHRKSSETNFAAKTKSGRPFSIDPNAPTTRTQYVKSSSSSSSSLCSFAEKIESSLRRTHFARCCFLSRFYSLSLSLSLSLANKTRFLLVDLGA
jgi:hypothetical protein